MTELDDSNLTPDDMRDWFIQEVRDLTKAVELRVRDATDFVTKFTQGKIGPPEAMDRLMLYESRWGDSPIPGVFMTEQMTDEEIIRQIDKGKEDPVLDRIAARLQRGKPGRSR